MRKILSQILCLILAVVVGGSAGIALRPAKRAAERYIAQMESRPEKVTVRYEYDPMPYASDDALTPEQQQREEEAQKTQHNAYVRRIVQGGNLAHWEKVALGDDEVNLIYLDVSCWRARESERLAEKRAEEPTTESYLTSQNDATATSGP